MRTDFLHILDKAVKAPSGHNTQPWTFRINGNCITIRPDYSRALPVVDPDNHALFISLGCALENIIVAAVHWGYAPAIYMELDKSPEERIHVTLSPTPETLDSGLFPSLDIRQTNRNRYRFAPIPPADLEELQTASRQEDVQCLLITDKKAMASIASLAGEAAKKQFSDPAFMEELVRWIRFNKKTAERLGDGLFGGTMGKPSVPTWLGRMFMNLSNNPEKEAAKHTTLINDSSALALFVAERNDKKAWVNLGRSFERFALTAASRGISIAHENMPCEDIATRQKLIQHLHLEDFQQPLLLIRMGYAERLPFSFRRPLQDTLLQAH
jgi:nitroreductase